MENVLEAEPGHPVGLATLSRVHAALGENELAKDYREKAEAVGVHFVEKT